MKKFHLLFLAVSIVFTACQKNVSQLPQSGKPSASTSNSKGLPFMSADRIPNDIIPLLYKSLLKDHLTEQAKNLATSYYSTLASRKDYNNDALKGLVPASGSSSGIEVAGANLNQRTVPSVGVVLDGNWFQTSGTTSCLLQDIGTTYIDFNAMNGTAPDAFSSTLPSSGQFLGTVDQPKRMQEYTLAQLQYKVSDNLGNTYNTGTALINYASYVQNLGWLNYVSAPQESGTIMALRIQAIRMYGPSYGGGLTLTFNDPAPSTQALMYVYYRVLIQDTGWEGWVSEAEVAGTTTQAKRLQAMQIRAYLIKV
jgi:hypothetical protein